MTLRLLRDTLSTCSTPGVALTYFSRRQVIVFSTSFGPSPGASVPTTSTGGVSSGKVSTAMRGVTTALNTTRAIDAISTAMGLVSDSLVIAARLRTPAQAWAPAAGASGSSVGATRLAKNMNITGTKN